MTRGRVWAIAFVLAAFTSACSGSDQGAPLLTTTTNAGVGGQIDLPGFVDPVFEQVDCPEQIARDGLACGLVELLLDRHDVAAGTIDISIATLAGADADGAAVAVLQGGPGGASTDLAAWVPRQPFTQVFIDQRGTGFARIDLDCPEYEEVLPQLLTLARAEVDMASEAALAACAGRLGDEPLLHHADSAHHADDVMTVMLGLGHVDEWYAYGVSYGSTIAMELLRERRPGLSGVVLDGVYPLWLDLDRAVADSAQASIDAVSDACAASVVCSSTTDDFATLLDRTVAQLDARPVMVPVARGDSGFGVDVTVRLDGRRLAELTFLLLYSEPNIARLPAAIAGIAAGDAEAAHWLAATGSRTLASSYRANDEGVYFAVQCSERVGRATGLDPVLGGFAGAIVSVPLAQSCTSWPVTPRATLGSISSSTPVLLLSGSFDPITPPAYAQDVADSLTNSTVVTQVGRSHGIWIGNGCIQGIVAAFVDGDGKTPRTDCADDPVTVDWSEPG